MVRLLKDGVRGSNSYEMCSALNSSVASLGLVEGRMSRVLESGFRVGFRLGF